MRSDGTQGERPRGIWPMLYAMFGRDGAVRRDAIRLQIAAAAHAGADGIAVLGLGTEARLLAPEERHALVEWVAEEARTLPFAVTITGASPGEQTEFARFAERLGASFVVLQPPPERIGEKELIAFFGATAGRLACPVAVQDAPQFLGFGLGEAGLLGLASAHPNVRIVKAEASAVEIARLIERLEGRMSVFNGRAGLELTDNLRAGAAGMIPGIETIDRQASCARAMAAGLEDAAEAAYAAMLPALAFIMQGIDHFVTYGKLLAAERLAIALDGQERSRLRPHPFGCAIVRRLAAQLGPLAAAPGR